MTYKPYKSCWGIQIEPPQKFILMWLKVFLALPIACNTICGAKKRGFSLLLSARMSPAVKNIAVH